MPDAFIVAADSIAVGVLQAFTAAGVLVPRDTSVISINNQSIAQYTSPTLTSYDIDQNELADTAITMLAEAISSRRTLHHHTFVSTTLVVRQFRTSTIKKLLVRSPPRELYSLLEQFQIHVERVGAIGGQLVLLMDGRAP